MHKPMLFLAAVFSLAAHFPAHSAGIVLNGDFENNSASATQFNMTNANFTATVADATAFGTSEELDLVFGTDANIAPQSGDWKVGLHQKRNDPAQFDAFTLALSETVRVGNRYRLSFWSATAPNPPPGLVEIGLSSTAGAFGTALFSTTGASTTAWTRAVFGFVATETAEHLSVRVGLPFDGYAYVDNFELSQVPLPAGLPLMLSALAVGVRLRRMRV